MKSVFFATDCIEDMHVWMQAMNQAAAVQQPPGYINSVCFLPARRYASAGLCDSDVSVCLSVRRAPVLCLAERKQDREMYTV